MTVRELFELCFRDHWNTERYLDSGWAKEVRGYFTRHVATALGGREVLSLGPKAVRDWHRSIPQKTAANRSLEVLSRMYTYAQEEELVPLGFNPCTSIKANVERKRSRFPTEEELSRIGEELERERKVHQVKAAFCELLALTGARPTALQRARRADLVVRGDVGFLTLHGKTTAETGEEDVIVFPPKALKIALALPVRDDGLLIGVVPYKRFWERITRRAGCPGLWLRDFRRGVATVGLSAGISIDTIGELLNHRSSQTTKIYGKLFPAARVHAAESIANRVSQLMSV